jgi:cytoskeletal protein CcmA (bactofilin family)
VKDVGDRNVTISGAGRIEAGSYGQVRIAGSAKAVGDIEAEEFKTAGSTRVEGSLRAKRFEAAGTFKCEGDLELEEGEAAGTLRVEGKIRAKELKLGGSARSQGITGGYLRSGGSLIIDGDVEVDTFRLSGAFQIAGLLAADKVEIQLEGDCHVREIGGEKIEIKRASRISAGLLSNTLEFLFRHGGPKELHAETIEGDEVYLEATVVKLVRGGKVNIGPGCRIGRVEYTDTLTVEPGAKVEEEVRG